LIGIEYDKETDRLKITLREARAKECDTVRPGVIADFGYDGDVVINDPATNLKVESVRHIYKRQDVIHAWAASHNTVYLVYPESAKIPKNRLGQWASK